eukprot:TRINITY_DN5829_c0_g1_i2.p1 TRINITY_DN5829_c0_g1~~TRINITY_DN5829_c0_g1_i2.p1  ORF type:complete len:100 (+),score=11.36 TRINITY_DN5829_c0_g1_i2:186-485(+)
MEWGELIKDRNPGFEFVLALLRPSAAQARCGPQMNTAFANMIAWQRPRYCSSESSEKSLGARENTDRHTGMQQLEPASTVPPAQMRALVEIKSTQIHEN